MSSHGALALVGSGEYLPVMQELEYELLQLGIARGKINDYVQIPTGAGKEGEDRLNFWKRRGAEQAERMGAEPRFLPVLTREDAFNAEFVKAVENAGLIYFSGGDPSHIAEVFAETPLWSAIVKAWKSGSSLAGCSAGAMAFGGKVVGLRMSHVTEGLGLLPDIEVIPHYDKFLGWLPDRIATIALRSDEGTKLLGIDENTAAVLTDAWRVSGSAQVHVLKGITSAPESYSSGQLLPLDL